MKQLSPLFQLFIAYLFSVIVTLMFIMFSEAIAGKPNDTMLTLALGVLCFIAVGFLTIRSTGVCWFWWKTIPAGPVIYGIMLTLWGQGIIGLLIFVLISWGAVLLGAFVARWRLAA